MLGVVLPIYGFRNFLPGVFAREYIEDILDVAFEVGQNSFAGLLSGLLFYFGALAAWRVRDRQRPWRSFASFAIMLMYGLFSFSAWWNTLQVPISGTSH
jgi:hypothetical protein